MEIDAGAKKIKDLIKEGQSRLKSGQIKKPPAYEWQDLALRVIAELSIPDFKRNAVFKVCRDYPKYFIFRCLNETKELCQTGQQWKYFFKLINQGKKRGRKELGK